MMHMMMRTEQLEEPAVASEGPNLAIYQYERYQYQTGIAGGQHDKTALQ